MRQSVSGRQYPMLLLGLFALVAVALATIGLYGVVSYGVGLRAREFGVRIALGATPRDVMRLVLCGGAWLALVGVVSGLLGAAVATRVLGHRLYGFAPGDPPTLAGVALLLAAVVLVAAWIPARRAGRADRSWRCGWSAVEARLRQPDQSTDLRGERGAAGATLADGDQG